MSIWVISDIHGQYDELEVLLGKLNESEDTLIFLGDYTDWGPHGVKVIRKLMDLQSKHRNIICLRGNHDDMVIEPCLEGLKDYRNPKILNYNCWLVDNGGFSTWKELAGLTLREQQIIFDWLGRLPVSYELNGYYFSHAWSGEDLWSRAFLTCRGNEFSNYKKAILGHNISREFDSSGYRIPTIKGNIICIDCGGKIANSNNPLFTGGRLCAYSPDTEEVIYSKA